MVRCCSRSRSNHRDGEGNRAAAACSGTWSATFLTGWRRPRCRAAGEPGTTLQLSLFPDKAEAAAPKVKGKKRKGKTGPEKDLRTNQEATTLDQCHAAMLLQASGRTNALRALLRSELDRGPDFLRLANAPSVLYPKESEEKRLLDAMLLAVTR